MGKIWLKSVDPNRQCCGCEGKAGPCDSCCAPITVQLPRAVGIPSDISQDPTFKPFEKYYGCKIYASSFDNWFISNSSLIGSVNSSQTEAVPSHSNDFKVSMAQGDTIIFNLSPKVGIAERPVNPGYNGNLDSLVYEVNRPAQFEINISFDGDITGADFTTVENNIEKIDFTSFLTFRKIVTLEGEIRPPVPATRNTSDLLIFGCPNLLNYPIGVNYDIPDASFLTQETIQIGTINRSYINRVGGWDLAGLNVATTDCSFFNRVDECGLLDGVSLIYGITDEVAPPTLPDPSSVPLGTVYSETGIPYFYIIQYRALDYFSGEQSEISTFSITANKNACIRISANGIFSAKNAGGSDAECFPSDILYTQMGVNISSSNPINLIRLLFSTNGVSTPCPES